MTIAREWVLQPVQRWLIGAVLILLMVAGLRFTLFLAVESYFAPFSAIDTRFAPGYSEEQFNSIQPGMSKEEVLRRLGPPLNGADQPSSWAYSEDGACGFWDFAWLVRVVDFDEQGRVSETRALVAHD